MCKCIVPSFCVWQGNSGGLRTDNQYIEVKNIASFAPGPIYICLTDPREMMWRSGLSSLARRTAHRECRLSLYVHGGMCRLCVFTIRNAALLSSEWRDLQLNKKLCMLSYRLIYLMDRYYPLGRNDGPQYLAQRSKSWLLLLKLFGALTAASTDSSNKVKY